jgi:hypothetical protein
MRHWFRSAKASPPHRIELKLNDVSQLFNTMDPSPFHEKDLDADAEEFILSWAREFPLNEPVVLIVYLARATDVAEAQSLIERATLHYFEYRSRLNRLEFKRLMEQGRMSLLIGLAFLTGCLFLSQSLAHMRFDSILVRESLTIVGWVAMWRPMEIYLYKWWPVRHEGRLYDKLSKMKVEVRVAEAH